MNTDIMIKSRLLSNAKQVIAKGNTCRTLSKFDNVERADFDPTNKEHLEHYKHFKLTGAWQGANPFTLEWPYTNVPAAIEAKIINHVLGL